MNYTLKVGAVEVERNSCAVHYRAWIVVDGNEFGNDLAMADANRKETGKNSFSFKAGLEVTDGWVAKQIENAEGFDEDEHGRARLTMPGGFHVVLVKDKD